MQGRHAVAVHIQFVGGEDAAGLQRLFAAQKVLEPFVHGAGLGFVFLHAAFAEEDIGRDLVEVDLGDVFQQPRQAVADRQRLIDLSPVDVVHQAVVEEDEEVDVVFGQLRRAEIEVWLDLAGGIALIQVPFDGEDIDCGHAVGVFFQQAEQHAAVGICADSGAGDEVVEEVVKGVRQRRAAERVDGKGHPYIKIQHRRRHRPREEQEGKEQPPEHHAQVTGIQTVGALGDHLRRARQPFGKFAHRQPQPAVFAVQLDEADVHAVEFKAVGAPEEDVPQLVQDTGDDARKQPAQDEQDDEHRRIIQPPIAVIAEVDDAARQGDTGEHDQRASKIF